MGSVPAESKFAPAGTTQDSAVLVLPLPVRVSMRLASMACLASPPVRYAFEFSARSAARFLRFSLGSALPTMTSFASASCCRRRATSSRIALQVLSTRHGFFVFGKSHWLSLLAFGGGGGGFSTATCAEEFAVRPRESVHVALTVIWPGEAPVVLRVALLPLPDTVPPVALQPATF